MSRIAIAAWDWPSIEGGGVSALTHTLAVGLVELGHSVQVWTRGGGRRTGALARATEPTGIEVVGLPGRSWRARGPSHWARAVPRILAGTPELLVVGSWDALPGLLDRLNPSVPLLCFAHGRDICAPMAPARDALRGRCLRAPSVRWLCLTRWMAGELRARGVPSSRVQQVPAAVPLPPAGARRDPPTLDRLLTVARLVPRKGHDTVYAALRLLPEPPRWDVVGEGPLALPEAPGVTLHGALAAPALERRWREADLFVMPCREEADGDVEGYGLVFLEAAARGLPSLAGRSGGAAEAVLDGVTGRVVNPTAEGVAAALRALREDPDQGRAWGLAGQARYLDCHRPRHLAAAVWAAR